MSEIKLTPYQATVFRAVETLLKKRGNLQGAKINPKAYWLSKQIAVYIMHNIGGTSTGVNNKVDVENVYDWLFGLLPPPPTTPVSNTGTATPPPPPPPPPPPSALFTDIGLSFGTNYGNLDNIFASSKQTLSFTTPPGFSVTTVTGLTLYCKTQLSLNVYGVGGALGPYDMNDRSFFKIGSIDGNMYHPLSGDHIELNSAGLRWSRD